MAAPSAQPTNQTTTLQTTTLEPLTQPSEPASRSTPPAPTGQVPNDAASWDQCFRQLEIAGMLKQLAGHCQFVRRDGDHLYFHLSQQQRHFLNQERQQQLHQALNQWAQQRLELHIDIVEVETNQQGEQELQDTPLQRQKLRKHQRQVAAQQSLDGDKLLQEFLDAFDANIIPGSVESVENDDA